MSKGAQRRARFAKLANDIEAARCSAIDALEHLTSARESVRMTVREAVESFAEAEEEGAVATLPNPQDGDTPPTEVYES